MSCRQESHIVLCVQAVDLSQHSTPYGNHRHSVGIQNNCTHSLLKSSSLSTFTVAKRRWIIDSQNTRPSKTCYRSSREKSIFQVHSLCIALIHLKLIDPFRYQDTGLPEPLCWVTFQIYNLFQPDPFIWLNRIQWVQSIMYGIPLITCFMRIILIKWI